MIRRCLALLALSLAAAPVASAAVTPAAPMSLSRAAQDSLRAAIDKDRRDTEEWLKEKPNSYLATIDRRDFGRTTTMTVGSAKDNDLRLADPSVQPHHLRVTVVGDSFVVRALDAKASLTLGVGEKAEVTRQARLGPSQIGVGRFVLRLSHQRYPAIIVFDAKSPRFKEYHGLQYYPVDFHYRYELPLTRNPKPDTVIIMSTRGNQRRAVRVGWFDFMVGKSRCRLEATHLLEPGAGESSFSVFFRDATTGKETYSVGRYLEAEAAANGKYVLDFNIAYNPACAFSQHYNCPIPPRGNVLPVAIRAGEKDSHYHH